MKNKITILLLLCFILGLSVTAGAEEAGSAEYESQKEILEGIIKFSGYDILYSDYCIELYAQCYDEVLQLQEYQVTDELAAFFYSCLYFYVTHDETTYGYWIGYEGTQALCALSNNDIDSFYEHMGNSLEFYNGTPDADESQSEENVEDMFSIGAGIYIVGEDVSAGKYDITAINRSGGVVCFYPDYEAYKNNGRKDSYYFLYAKDHKYYSDGDSTTANNIRLEDGNCIEIESGLELQFAVK